MGFFQRSMTINCPYCCQDTVITKKDDMGAYLECGHCNIAYTGQSRPTRIPRELWGPNRSDCVRITFVGDSANSKTCTETALHYHLNEAANGHNYLLIPCDPYRLPEKRRELKNFGLGVLPQGTTELRIPTLYKLSMIPGLKGSRYLLIYDFPGTIAGSQPIFEAHCEYLHHSDWVWLFLALDSWEHNTAWIDLMNQFFGSITNTAEKNLILVFTMADKLLAPGCPQRHFFNGFEVTAHFGFDSYLSAEGLQNRLDQLGHFTRWVLHRAEETGGEAANMILRLSYDFKNIHAAVICSVGSQPFTITSTAETRSRLLTQPLASDIKGILDPLILTLKR
jgi:hypothetical protein